MGWKKRCRSSRNAVRVPREILVAPKAGWVPSPEKGRHGEGGENRDRGRVQGRVKRCPIVGGQTPAEHSPEPRYKLWFTAKDADHFDASQVFLQACVDQPDRGPIVTFRLPHSPLQDMRDENQGGGDQSSHEAQHRTEGDHGRHDGAQSYQIGQEHGHSRGEDGVEGVDVGRAAADHVAEGGAIEVAGRQALQMREEPGAQVAQHSLGAGGGKIPVQKGRRLHGGDGQQVEQGEREHALGVPDGEMSIHDRANDERRGELEGGRGQHQEPDQRRADPLLGQQTQQIAHHRRTDVGASLIVGRRARSSKGRHRRALTRRSPAPGRSGRRDHWPR